VMEKGLDVEIKKFEDFRKSMKTKIGN
jgi:hypothetical protein